MTAIFKRSADAYRNFWRSIVGSDRVEVLVPRGNINCARPGSPPKWIDPGQFFQIDVASLSAVQRQRLVQALSSKWKVSVTVVEGWLSDSHNGIPLIASDVVVAMGLFQ